MSNTIKGSKGPGYDFWGKRSLSGICGHGSKVKKLTHKLDRKRQKHKLIKGDYEKLPKREAF